MASEKFEAPDLQKFIASLRPDADHLDDLRRRPEPQLLPVPSVVRGFRIRIDLQRTKPPVWRRVEVPGDILLPRFRACARARPAARRPRPGSGTRARRRCVHELPCQTGAERVPTRTSGDEYVPQSAEKIMRHDPQGFLVTRREIGPLDGVRRGPDFLGNSSDSLLGYLDSNQEQLNQNQPCCQLHHTPWAASRSCAQGSIVADRREWAKPAP